MAVLASPTDVHLTSTSTNFPNAVSPLTLMTWINYDAWESADIASMVGVYSTPLGTAMQIGKRAPANQIAVWTWGGGILINTATLPLVNNEWIHVTYTFNGTSTSQLYVNGVFSLSATSTQVAGTLTTMYINGYPTGLTNETSNIQADDTILFNRVLSADEIMTIYTCAGGVDGINEGVLARYRYDEGVDGTNVVSVLDYSGNGNVLTPSGPGTPMTYTSTYIARDIRPVII